MVASLRRQPAQAPELSEKIRVESAHFERNAERMRYPEFRRQDLVRGANAIAGSAATYSAESSKTTGFQISRRLSRKQICRTPVYRNSGDDSDLTLGRTTRQAPMGRRSRNLRKPRSTSSRFFADYIHFGKRLATVCRCARTIKRQRSKLAAVPTIAAGGLPTLGMDKRRWCR